MKYLKITNSGELDIRLVALMGGTTKANDQYKIGQFGTGLKYTLAYLFRNNLNFKIFAGTEAIKVSLEFEDIKDEHFEIICINGNRTSITTRMGLEWNAWMIIRELWCNALDEGGNRRDVVSVEDFGVINGTPGETSFYIQINSEVQKVLDDWNKYFIHDVEPMADGVNYAIYNSFDHLRLYKQGVLIHEAEGQKALFNYDIKNASINELREFRGTKSMEMSIALKKAPKKTIEYFLENVTSDHYEGCETFDYDWGGYSFSDQWKEVIGDAKIIHPEALKNLQEKGIEMDMARAVVVPKKVYTALTQQFPGIGALRVANKVNEFYETVNQALEQKIKEALVILESCDYYMAPELKFVYGCFGDKNVNAQVNLDTKEILLSDSLINASLFKICAILIEECEHFNTGFSDCSRSFQQHFIDLFTKTLLDKHAVKL